VKAVGYNSKQGHLSVTRKHCGAKVTLPFMEVTHLHTSGVPATNYLQKQRTELVTAQVTDACTRYSLKSYGFEQLHTMPSFFAGRLLCHIGCK
jgi:hypothetical protein